MKTTDNAILITGGGSGIGRGLAEAFHHLGNQVIIAGRGRKALDETIAANTGIKSVTLDVSNPKSVQSFVARVTKDYPSLHLIAALPAQGDKRGSHRADPALRADHADGRPASERSQGDAAGRIYQRSHVDLEKPT